MRCGLELILRDILIGAGATVAMDLWAVFLRRCYGVPSLDYGMVGRWLGYFRRAASCIRVLGWRHPFEASASSVGALTMRSELRSQGRSWASRAPSGDDSRLCCPHSSSAFSRSLY